jgi:tRNA nucleotidyltransferase/poly(A) polymerase
LIRSHRVLILTCRTMDPEALARQVIRTLRASGHQAYLVGGCVRDLLLGAKPKDFDIATDARPDRIMDLFPKSGRVGAHFGVVLVRDVFDQVEVATFRSDHEYEDGRHPEHVLRATRAKTCCVAISPSTG